MDTATTTFIVLRDLAGNAPTSLNTMQQFLLPHLQLFSDCWWSIWIMTAIVIIVKYVQEYRRDRN